MYNLSVARKRQMHKWLQNLNSIVVVPNEEIIYSEDVFSSFTE